MPRNRRDIERDQKVEDVVRSAEAALRAGGFEHLSMSAIARDLGLARGAINWYFPTRDHLFVAALRRMFGEALAKPPRAGGYKRLVAWAVGALAELQPLTMALHDRARTSAVAAELEQEIERRLCDGLRAMLTGEVPDERLDVTARTIETFVQGLLARERTPKERKELLDVLLTAVVP